MPGLAVVNGGNYDVEIDCGFVVDGFTLDDSLRGVLDSTSYVLDGTTTFASVTDGVTSLSINRGRKNSDDQFPSGTAGFVLNDSKVDGVFGPFDTAPTNPYYDATGNVPGLAPGRAVRITRYDAANVAERLFTGYIVNYDYNFSLSGQDTVAVTCADAFYRLAQTFISAHNPTKELTGARINAILDRTEVAFPSGAARDIATGTVELGGSSSYAIAEGTNVKAYFDAITTTAERGRIFIDRSGVLVSENRIGATLSAPVLDLTDDGTGVPYKEISITFEAQDITNRVAVTPAGGSQQVANDAASQTKYFVKALYLNGSLLHDNSAALTLANYLLEPEPAPRFDSVGVWFGSLTNIQRDAATTVDIGQTVKITKSVLVGGVPTEREQESAVEGIEHRITPNGGHYVKYFTSPTDVVYAFTLDDATYGVLDADNALT
jgi:hypothetical protein